RGSADAWTSFGASEETQGQAGRPAAAQAPTGAPAMVDAAMTATPTPPVGARYDENGSTTVGEQAGSAAAVATFTPVELPPRRGVSGATLAALAAVAGLGAIALGAWGVASSVSGGSSPSQTPAALQNVQQVVSLISKPSTTTIPIQGSGG